MDEHLWVQVEEAARGCISGTLKEWPHLYEALFARGMRLSQETGAITLQKICKLLVFEREHPTSRRRTAADVFVDGTVFGKSNNVVSIRCETAKDAELVLEWLKDAIDKEIRV